MLHRNTYVQTQSLDRVSTKMRRQSSSSQVGGWVNAVFAMDANSCKCVRPIVHKIQECVYLTDSVEGEMGTVLAAGVAPPEAQPTMEYAHCQLEEDDEHDLDIEEVVKGTCAQGRGNSRTHCHDFKIPAGIFQIDCRSKTRAQNRGTCS